MGTKKITEEQRKKFYKMRVRIFIINLIILSILYFGLIGFIVGDVFNDTEITPSLRTFGIIIGLYVLNTIIHGKVINKIGARYIRNKKPVKEKIGTMPVNSRITIDYTGKKPTIKFDYPKKDVFNQVTNSSITPLTAALFAGLTLAIIALMMYDTPGFYSGDPEDCTVYRQIINISGIIGKSNNLRFDFDCIIDGKNVSMPVTFVEGQYYGLIKPHFTNVENNLITIYHFIAFLILYFFYKYLVSYIFSKTRWGHKNFPELNKKLHDRRYSCEWKPKHVKNNQLELPLFRNIYMDYEFTKEMSDNLQKVQIVEHPFNVLTRKGGRFSRPKIKKSRNVYFWKAVFTFSKQPKTGKGLVRWT